MVVGLFAGVSGCRRKKGQTLTTWITVDRACTRAVWKPDVRTCFTLRLDVGIGQLTARRVPRGKRLILQRRVVKEIQFRTNDLFVA